MKFMSNINNSSKVAASFLIEEIKKMVILQNSFKISQKFPAT